MIHILIIHLRNLAPFLLFLAVVLATAGSGAEELPNLTDKERAWLAQNHSVRVRVTNFAPHIFLDGDEPKGISVDYVNLIAERTGINFVYAEGKGEFWQAVESMGRGDGPDLIVGMESHPERAEEISFSKIYMVAPHVIFTREESEFVSGIEDLSGKTLAATRGGPSERIAKEYGDLVMAWFPSERAALEAVSKGQADAYMGDLLVATFMIETFGYSNLKVAAPGPLGDRRLCFGSRADWPELTSMINKALDSIPRAEQSAVKGKYLSVRYEYGIRTRDVVKWVMIMTGGGLLIVLLFVNWNRQLQRTVEKQTAEVVKGATQLENSKAQLEEAQRISRTGSWELDIATDTVNWSKGFYNIVGRELGKPAPTFAETPQLFTSESFERLNLAVGEAVNNGISFALELGLIREDGELRSISAVGEPIRDTAGIVTGLRGSIQDISERKRAEEALAVSERLFRATFEQAAVGIAHVAPDGGFLRLNQKFCDIVGYAPEEMLKLNFQDITHPEDLDVDVKQVDRLLRGKLETYSLEKRYLPKHGDQVWVNLTVSLVRNEVGEPEYFVSVIQDVTDRKQAAEQLVRTATRLQLATAAAQIGLYEFDPQTREIYYSPEWKKQLGYADHELTNRFEAWESRLHPDDRESTLKAVEAYLSGEASEYIGEFRLQHKDGSYRWIFSRAAKQVDEHGHPVRLQGCHVDISELKHAEEAGKEKERQLSTLMSNLPGMVYRCLNDQNWTMAFVSKGSLSLTGYSPDDFTSGRVLFNDLIPTEEQEPIRIHVQEALNEKRLYQLTYRIRTSSGDLKWVWAQGQGIFDDKQELVALEGFITDITERKQAELQLQEYQQRLKALASQLTVAEERERHRIATDLHDHVCQTLAVMRLQLATLCKRVKDPKVVGSLNEFSASLLQANRDTRHLMFDLSSPTLNELGLAAAIAEWLEEELEQRHGLKTEFQDIGLSQPLDQDLRAVLFRNVRELLTNVVKHAQAQRVKVILQQSGTTVSLVVNDDGVGFDPNQATSGEREHPAFGLFSIQERMADMGGSMEVVSTPGQGCTVTLTLPVPT